MQSEKKSNLPLNLPEPKSEEKAKIISATRQETRIEEFSGPLPRPQTLKEYDEIIPNGAERIMSMAEEQSRHRRDMEALMIRGNVRSQRHGLTASFTLNLTALVSGTFLAYNGIPILGGILSVGGLLSIAASWISWWRSRNFQDEERAEKSKPFQEPPES